MRETKIDLMDIDVKPSKCNTLLIELSKFDLRNLLVIDSPAGWN